MNSGPPEEDVVFRALFESAPDAIVVVDAAGLIVQANGACEGLLGYPPSALCGRSVETLVPARFDQHPRQREEYGAHPAARPMGRGLDLVARHADGREIPVDISLAPIAVGGRRLVACALRDMSRRARDGESLRVQATALRSAANGVVITDRTGTITWVNPAACAITGYSAEELVGRHTRLLKSGRHASEFYASLWATVTRGEIWSGTIVNRRKDGTEYFEAQTIAPVVDEAGVISHFIAIKEDVSEQRRTEAELARAHEELSAHAIRIETLNRQLSEQAVRDPLTGLHNRRYFDEAIAREAARADRAGEPLTLAMLDIDRFKRVNDTWGHAAGDLVLQAFANLLRAQVRTSDLAARLGGEEFVVAMPHAALDVARQRAEAWRAAFAALPVTIRDGETVRCTVSIGLAQRQGLEEPVEETLRRADAALFSAKRAGRNRVV